jgi:DNA polymerase-4
LSDADGADFADLIDRRTAEAEQAMDRLRERFGDDAVVKGLALDRDDDDLEE